MNSIYSCRNYFAVVVFLAVLALVDRLGYCGTYGGGSGTPGDPYLIYTAAQMNAIGANSIDWNKHFKLMADIDLSMYSGDEYNIIDNFSGVFDGAGHTIHNLTYSSSNKRYVGLFARVEGDGAIVRNLGLIDPNVTMKQDDSRGGVVGSLVGSLRWGTISCCWCEGGNVTGDGQAGGLVGTNYYEGTILNCYSTASVLGSMGSRSVGGLVGDNLGVVSNCYSTGLVSGNRGVGGLVGYNDGILKYCYSTGMVSGDRDVGGLVGRSGGIITVIDSFWDIETSGQLNSVGGQGNTTTEMQRASTFFSWGVCDNEGIWTLDEGNDYPRLWWENKPGDRLPPHNLSDFLAGRGTRNEPYLIYTAEQLNIIGLFQCEWDAHFKLMADVDLSNLGGTNFNVIGKDPTPFTGIFKGNYHKISNFTYYSSGEYGAGLFGLVSGSDAKIKDLGLINPHVDAGTGGSVGSLVGWLGKGKISNCFAIGGSILGYFNVGGLVGYNKGQLTNCYSMVSVSGKSSIGGLVGDNKGIINHSYSTGAVSGDRSVGGLVGRNSDMVIDSFWDMETSGQLRSSGGIGKTTAEMRSASTFIGWGCDPVWTIDEGNDYPRLFWENRPGEIINTKGKFGGGCGTQSDPYLIYTAEHMNAIGEDLSNWNKHFKLMADIDIGSYKGKKFNIIGYYVDIATDKPFRGVFDGNGHTISNFNYTCKGINHVGLFGYVNGSVARIRNVGLIAPRVNAGTGYYVGSLIGWLKGGRTTGCYADGGNVSGGYNVGGLVGRAGAKITNCYSNVSVSGIAGVGGLVGINYRTVSKCYSVGFVSGNSSIGGLIGSDLNLGTARYSFWDIETSGQIRSDGGAGKTTTEMQTTSTFTNAGWDFTTPIWTIREGVDYPRLWWENTAPVACIVGGSRIVEAGSNCEARVVLNGSCSSDEDSTPGTNDDINDFDWYEVIDPCDPNSDIYIGSGEVIECNLPLGEHDIILEVTDKACAFDSNEVTITVEDVTPPEFSLWVEPNVLWPVNHTMVEITPSWEVSDNCDEWPDVSLVSITMNEDAETKGGGHTIGDIWVDANDGIQLRAERSGKETGRVYTITYQAVDDSNNVTIDSAAVTVPHDMR